MNGVLLESVKRYFLLECAFIDIHIIILSTFGYINKQADIYTSTSIGSLYMKMYSVYEIVYMLARINVYA